jgi:hypothetical protein
MRPRISTWRVDREPISDDPEHELSVAPAPGDTLIDGRRRVPDVVNNIIGPIVTRPAGDTGWSEATAGCPRSATRFYGSLPGIEVHVANIVTMAVTKSGLGYWLISSHGEVFAFGDAPPCGSTRGPAR